MTLKVEGHIDESTTTGTSTKGPMTAANATPELMPNTETATAIASSKLLEAAVNAQGCRLGIVGAHLFSM